MPSLVAHRAQPVTAVRPRHARNAQMSAIPVSVASRPIGWSWKTGSRGLRSCAISGEPALGLLLPGGGLAGQGCPPAGAQAVDDDGQVALPELGGAACVAELDAGQELQQELNVQVGDIVPEQA